MTIIALVAPLVPLENTLILNVPEPAQMPLNEPAQLALLVLPDNTFRPSVLETKQVPAPARAQLVPQPVQAVNTWMLDLAMELHLLTEPPAPLVPPLAAPVNTWTQVFVLQVLPPMDVHRAPPLAAPENTYPDLVMDQPRPILVVHRAMPRAPRVNILTQ